VVIADKNGLFWIDDLAGGLNDTDAPQAIAFNQCQVAQNVEWTTTRGFQRRQGGTNGINATEPWGASASLFTLMRHTPSADESAAELWGVDSQTTPVMARMAAGNQFNAVTVGDAWSQANAKFINGVSLNGKFFVAGDTAQDRLHVWTGSTFRRVGLATPAAPTVADAGGAGTYPAILRYYKIQWQNATASPNVLSELSPAVSFTPGGADIAARVTRPALPSESETHWILWGSPDGVNYYIINSATAATTIIDDSTAPSGYATAIPALAGYPSDADYYTPPISTKYLLADEDRLLLLSSWDNTTMASAVMWTPVLGTTDPAYSVADDERVPSGNRLDLDRSDGGGITGGAIANGTVYVFKLSQIYRLRRTGDPDLPYQPIPVTKSLGALTHKSIVVGEDEAGNACVYFLSRRGPYRLTEGGLEYLGRDIETTWDAVNFAPVTLPFGVWHDKKRQVQWWITTAASGAPNTKLVFHVRHGQRDGAGNVRGGWAIHTDGAAAAHCACMFANTLGSTMSLDLKPYVGQVWVTGLPDGPCIKYDADGRGTDRGGNETTYIGRVKTAALAPGGPGMKGRVQQAYLLGKSNSTTCTLAVDILTDFGAATRSGTAALPTTGIGGASRRFVKVEDDARAADSMYVEVIVDDDVVGNTAGALWTVDAIGLRVKAEGPI
jgi:hypothetical protein